MATNDLEALRDALRTFARERDWDQFHSPKNLAMALAGEAGELLVRGPQVFSGYINLPDEDQPFYEDWFCTGDMAVMEEDGFIRIVSRIKETIITGGFNIYPAEVEEFLEEHE